jgi:hypothetical protein
MVGLTVALRQEKIRNLILGILLHKSRATAREIAYELQVYDIWKSPGEITALIRGDPQLNRCIDIDYENFGGWSRMVYTLKRDYNAR